MYRQCITQAMLLMYESQLNSTPSGVQLPLPPTLIREDQSIRDFILNSGVGATGHGVALIRSFVLRYCSEELQRWSRESAVLDGTARGNLWQELYKTVLPYLALPDSPQYFYSSMSPIYGLEAALDCMRRGMFVSDGESLMYAPDAEDKPDVFMRITPQGVVEYPELLQSSRTDFWVATSVPPQLLRDSQGTSLDSLWQEVVEATEDQTAKAAKVSVKAVRNAIRLYAKLKPLWHLVRFTVTDSRTSNAVILKGSRFSIDIGESTVRLREIKGSDATSALRIRAMTDLLELPVDDDDAAARLISAMKSLKFI